MTHFIARRLLIAVPTLLGAMTLIFVALRVLPGDPVTYILGDTANQAAADALRERLGLNQPLWKQYVSYLLSVVRGDFGRSLVTNRDVTQVLWSFFPYTAELAVASLMVATVIGVTVGSVSAIKRETPLDYVGRTLALAAVSVPNFYLGILLLIVFSAKLGWLPTAGVGDAGNFIGRLPHLVLPAIALGTYQAGLTMRVTRSSLLDVVHEDYVRTARAKGAPEGRVLIAHVLRNALLPIVTVLGLQVATLLGGTVVTESVFARPGLGTMMLNAIAGRDYPLLQGALTLFALLVVVVNLVIDLLYAALDPRVQYE